MLGRNIFHMVAQLASLLLFLGMVYLGINAVGERSPNVYTSDRVLNILVTLFLAWFVGFFHGITKRRRGEQ